MAIIKLPHFGRLDTNSLDEYYEIEMSYNNSQIHVDLNFTDKNIELERLETVKNFIDNIRIHDINNKKYIDNDYNDTAGHTVKFYLQDHLEDLGENELSALINLDSKKAGHEKQLKNKLHLIRVGIYPKGEDQFATFDYSIGRDITDSMIVIDTDENGNLLYMTMES